MVKFKRLPLFFLILMFAPAFPSHATTINITPNPAVVGQIVTITVTGIGTTNQGAACGRLEIDYGDGNGWQNLGNCRANPCQQIITRAFQKVGSYVIRSRISVPPGGDASCIFVPPNPATLTLTVVSPITCPMPSALPRATFNVLYRHEFKTTGGLEPLYYRVSENTRLPNGLVLNTDKDRRTGILSGVPTESGNFNFVLQIKDAFQMVDCRYSIAVGPALSCPRNAPPDGEAGRSYSHQFTPTNVSQDGAPYLYKLDSGFLPAGLKLSPSGLISGNPTQVGRFQFTLKLMDKDKEDRFSLCPYSISINPAKLKVTETPKRTTLMPGQPLATTNYRFTCNPGVNTILSSDKGVFIVAGQGNTASRLSAKDLSAVSGKVIGVVLDKKEVRLSNGGGNLTESIKIPSDVSKRIAELGFPPFSYVREWSSDVTETEASAVILSKTSDLESSLMVTDIRLYFENKRPKITIERNREKLVAFADLRIIGRGILEVRWEVDGKFHSRIIQHVDAGRERILTVSTPDPERIHRIQQTLAPATGPYLRTFDEGTHEVKLIIVQPRMDVAFPTAIYFVKAETEIPIVLISPQHNAEGDMASVRFQWNRPKSDLKYVIEFSHESDGKPFYSAETSQNQYSFVSINPAFQKHIFQKFTPGENVFWRVRALDPEGKAVGESEERQFIPMVSPAEGVPPSDRSSSVVPGQILVLLRSDPGSQGLLEKIGTAHGLRLMEVHDLASLGQRLALFQTGEDIGPIIDALKGEPELFLAQPNRILKTLTESSEKDQYAYKALRLDWLHNFIRGKGVLVAMVDTGADISHPDLKDRIVRHENFVPDSEYRAEIHGTATASLAAASLNGFGIAGVAPEADLMILRACRQMADADPAGECYTTSISRAIDAAIVNQAKVVNLSVGCDGTDLLISRLLEEGEKRGILFVAPVGNAQDYGGIPFPASHPSVIAVAGTDDQGAPYPSTEIARKARACAPAVNILAAFPGNGHRVFSGTSLSSATISGLLALACEKNSRMCLKELPANAGSLCKWEEELFQISFCEETKAPAAAKSTP